MEKQSQFLKINNESRVNLELKKYEKNIYSQFGQDGVLEEVLSKICPLENINAFEVGGWDGVKLSNICNLAVNHNSNCIFVEANKKKYLQILENHKSRINKNKVFAFNEYLTAKGGSSAGNLIKKAGIKELDFISIDVDGMDYFIFRDLDISPKVILIEFNQTFHSDIEFIQEEDPSLNFGASSTAIAKLAIKKGYSIIHYFECDLLLVRNDLLEKMHFKTIPYQEITSKHYSYIGFGYDAKMFSFGFGEKKGPYCPWEKNLKISTTKFQALPSFLQIKYDSPKPVQFILLRFFIRLIYIGAIRKIPSYIKRYFEDSNKR